MLIAAAVATLGTSVPALAVTNPLVAPIIPLAGSSVRGNVTFFQLGKNVAVGLNLTGSGGAQALDLRKGSCKSYAATPAMPLGSGQDTQISNTTLAQLSGQVLLIHKSADVASAPVGCAEIKS
jgi:hypothetical protein